MSLAMRLRAISILAIAVTTTTGTRAAAQSPPSLGEVVLLANASGDARDAALRAALRSSDPAIRRAAGRVTAVRAVASLHDDLLGALAREQDPYAGAELVRHLLHLGVAADLPAIEQQSQRLGLEAQLALGEWHARTDPARFVKDLGTIGTDDRESYADLVNLAIKQHPEAAATLRRAWMPIAPARWWSSMLTDTVVTAEDFTQSAALLSEALSSSRPEVSEETVWFVFGALVEKRPVPAAVVSAASAARDGVGDWEAFGRELIARNGKSPKGEGRATLIRDQGKAHSRDLSGVPLAVLTPGERAAVAELALQPRPPLSTPFPDVAPVRLVDPFVRGLFGSVLRTARCNGSTNMTQALVVYGPDGFPRNVQADPAGLSPECQAAWLALAGTSLADSGEPIAGDPQVVALPLAGDYLTCADDDVRDRARKLGTNTSTIDVPHKVKDVRPEYPQVAIDRHIQGVVIIAARISATGCVASARVLRALPYLTAPALRAVTQWRFTPTTLNGTPVPVMMSVTVNFRLQ